MEENFNSDLGMLKTPRTSSTDGKNSSKTSGDSEVQAGQGVVDHEVERPYEKGDDQQEYIEQSNNNTKIANENPVKNGKGMTASANSDEHNDDEKNHEDDPLTQIVIGDDPNDTKDKITLI